MHELNEDYLNNELTENPKWYNGANNKKTGVFDKSKVLKNEAQQLIDDAIWYLGGSANNQTLAKQYANERGTRHVNNPSDGVKRTNTWIGKVGLVYVSDFGYGSSNLNCKNNLSGDPCKEDNWMLNGVVYWTITPYYSSNSAVGEINAYGHVNQISSYYNYNIKPSVYLKTNVVITGLGTNDTNKFKFSL